MDLFDLYAIHERAAKSGALTIHPARWLFAGRRVGGVFDFFSAEKETVQIGNATINHFRGLGILAAEKRRNEHGYYLVTEAIAHRYATWVPPSHYVERAVKDMYALVNPESRLEVKTPAGSIDILIPRAIIEVKHERFWKCALGQILAYAHYHPSRARIIHLIRTSTYEKSLLAPRRVCSEFNVRIQYQTLESGKLGPRSQLGPVITLPSERGAEPVDTGHARKSDAGAHLPGLLRAERMSQLTPEAND